MMFTQYYQHKVSVLERNNRVLKKTASATTYHPKLSLTTNLNLNGKIQDVHHKALWCRHLALLVHRYGMKPGTQLLRDAYCNTASYLDMIEAHQLDQDLKSVMDNKTYFTTDSVSKLLIRSMESETTHLKLLLFSEDHCVAIEGKVGQDYKSLNVYDPNTSLDYVKIIIDEEDSFDIFESYPWLTHYFTNLKSGFMSDYASVDSGIERLIQQPLQALPWLLRHNHSQVLKTTDLATCNMDLHQITFTNSNLIKLRKIVSPSTIESLSGQVERGNIQTQLLRQIVFGTENKEDMLQALKLNQSYFIQNIHIAHILLSLVDSNNSSFQAVEPVIDFFKGSSQKYLALFAKCLNTSQNKFHHRDDVNIFMLQQLMKGAFSTTNTESIAAMLRAIDQSTLAPEIKRDVIACQDQYGIPAYATFLFFNRDDIARLFIQTVSSLESLEGYQRQALNPICSAGNALSVLRDIDTVISDRLQFLLDEELH